MLGYAKPVSVTLGTLFMVLVVAACGEQVSTADRACPCESGWTCCGDNVCVAPGAACQVSSAADALEQCPAGVTLIPDLVGSVVPLVNGKLLGTVPAAGTSIGFDYASTASLAGNDVTLQGWVLLAGGTLGYHFRVYTEDGSNVQQPLALVAYGPIELGPTAGTCLAPLLDGGPLPMTASSFQPPTWGRYFITAYHDVTVDEAGTLTIHQAGSSNAFLSIEPSTPAQ